MRRPARRVAAARWQVGLTVAVLVALALAVAVVWVQVARTFTASRPAKTTTATSLAVVWGGHVYTTAASLRVAVTERGVDWQRWVAHHPAVFPRRSAGQAPLAAAPPRTSSDRSLRLVFAIVGVLLAAASFTPRSLAGRLSERLSLADYRTPLLAAAASVGVGLIVASAL